VRKVKSISFSTNNNEKQVLCYSFLESNDEQINSNSPHSSANE